MRYSASRITLPSALMILLMSSSPLVAQETAWKIGPRSLPASFDVSEVMRESLLRTPAPDVSAAKAIALRTDEEWEAWAMEGDVPTAAAARALAEALSVSVKEDKVAGVSVHRVTPPEIDETHRSHLFVYIHGGAWVRNAGIAGTIEAVLIAARLKTAVLSIDYRMPPRHPAPAATDDVIAVWKQLLEERSPASVCMGGTSAGGNITLSSVHRFKDLGLPVPGALYVGTPAVDVEMIGDSRSINEGIDRSLVSWEGIPRDSGVMYAGGHNLKHPYVSPIYGDFSGFPPSYLVSGMRDLLLSDTVRAHRNLRRAGVEADLHVYEGQSHADYIVEWTAPESVEHYAELNSFLLKHLDKVLVPASTPSSGTSKQIKIPKSAGY